MRSAGDPSSLPYTLAVSLNVRFSYPRSGSMCVHENDITDGSRLILGSTKISSSTPVRPRLTPAPPLDAAAGHPFRSLPSRAISLLLRPSTAPSPPHLVGSTTILQTWRSRMNVAECHWAADALDGSGRGCGRCSIEDRGRIEARCDDKLMYFCHGDRWGRVSRIGQRDGGGAGSREGVAAVWARWVLVVAPPALVSDWGQ